MIAKLSIIISMLSAFSFNVGGQILRVEAGLVKKVIGKVSIHCHLGGPQFSELRKGDVLHKEDTLVTSKDSSAVFSLNPDSFVLMSSETAVTVRETTLSAMHFDVVDGEVIAHVSGLKNGAALVFHAPPGILEIRKKGLYRVFVDPDQNTQVNVIRGELVYRDNANRPARLTTGKKVDFLKRASVDIDH